MGDEKEYGKFVIVKSLVTCPMCEFWIEGSEHPSRIAIVHYAKTGHRCEITAESEYRNLE